AANERFAPGCAPSRCLGPSSERERAGRSAPSLSLGGGPLLPPLGSCDSFCGPRELREVSVIFVSRPSRMHEVKPHPEKQRFTRRRGGRGGLRVALDPLLRHLRASA